jgi:hypothetical protein
MANDDIQGTITDSNGNSISNAVVTLFLNNNPNKAITTQADSNGNYIFNNHPDGDGTTKNWHLAAYDPNDTSRQFKSLHSVSASLADSIPDSAVSRWTLNDTDTGSGKTTDSWGGNDATLNNGVTTGIVGANQTYNTGEGHSYDGTGDDAITQNAGVTSFPFTLAVWTKTSSSGVVISIHGGNTSHTMLRVQNGKLLWGNYANSNYSGYGGNTIVSDGEWHHLIIAVSSSNAVGYVDGAQDWSASHSAPFPSVDEILFGIQRTSDDASRFAGNIDDIRLYDKQITSTEASNLYNTGYING